MLLTIAQVALSWLLTYAIHSTILLVVAWGATRRWARHPATAELFWKGAMLGGILTASVQLLLERRPAGTIVLPSAASVPALAPTTLHTAPPATAPDGAAPTTAPGDAGPTSGAPTREGWRLPLVPLLFGTWLVAAIALVLAYLGRRLVLVGRLTERHRVADDPVVDMLDGLRRDMGHDRAVLLTTATTISSPLAMGRSEICVPTAVLTDLEPEQQRAMLAHELAHLVRRDPFWLALASVVERLFFFQPLNRIARRGIQESAEYLCDAMAARRAGSGIPLARCLAKVAEWIQTSPLGVPVAGMAEQRSLLVSRIQRLIDGSMPTAAGPRRGAAVTVLVALVAVVFTVPGVSSRLAVLPPLDAGALDGGTPGDGTPRGKVGEREAAERAARLAEGQARIDENRKEQSAEERNAAIAALDPATRGLVNEALGSVMNGEPADTAVIRELIRMLKDFDAGVRAAAARSLGQLENRMALPALIGALKDEEAQVRAAAADAVGDFEDPRAIVPLLDLLDDVDADVRQEALNALGHYDRGVASAPVVRLLNDGNADIRREAAHLLRQIGDRSTAPALVKLLTDQWPEVRIAALEALQEVGTAEIGAAIVPLLKDGNGQIRYHAVYAICELKVPLSDAAITTLLRDGSADVRQVTATMLGERRLVSMIPELRRLALEDGAADVRYEAVDALATYAEDAARDALRAALRSTDAKVRKRAAEALGDRS